MWGHKPMKYIMPALLAGIVVLSGLGAVTTMGAENQPIIQNFSYTLTTPVIRDEESYALVDLNEMTSYLMDEGKPMLPVVTKTYTYPVGTVLDGVDVSFVTQSYNVPYKIQPAPSPVSLSDTIIPQTAIDPQPDSTVYNQAGLYPQDSYRVRTGVGLKDGERVLYVNVDCFAQYEPLQNTVYVPTDIDITLKYNLPKSPLFTANEYDLLIITDETFKDALQPLVDHKNSHGIRTIVETTQEIYSTYPDHTQPEAIKLSIKDAIENWGITYVLLAGGRKGETFNWYIPEFRSNNNADTESGYATDLYYADIYKEENGQVVFDNWDSNGNGKLGEYRNMLTKDVMDFYPDVVIGRLPFRYPSQVSTVVNKIIQYENTAQDSWFKKAVLVAGDTFPPSRGGTKGWYEGELETSITEGILESAGFSIEKLWLSIPGAWESSQDVTNQINSGVGFIHFAGHGNPAAWGNHPPDDEEHVFIQGFQLRDMSKYTNSDELPIMVIGGCHNAQFNVTMSNILTEIRTYGIVKFLTYYMYLMSWVPMDGASWFVMENGGGAIATMGCTGFGYGYVNENWDKGLGGWIEPRFFNAYANQSKDILGEAHDQAIVDYINIIGNVNNDQIDRKTIEEWVLIGDPTLKIGGY
jgi:hypothetical protein